MLDYQVADSPVRSRLAHRLDAGAQVGADAAVLRAMDAASAGRTTLIIAHRTSTVMDADAICVLRGGVVVEEGTHAALMSRRGTPPAGSYADLSSSRGGGDDDATPP